MPGVLTCVMDCIRPCSDREHTTILAIVNGAAEAYRGVIPADRWQQPYMTSDELARELAAGVDFWGYESDGVLLGVMGIQRVRDDVALIRHAYVRPAAQRQGLGSALLEHIQRVHHERMLVGTWAAATWAIRFYENHGFELVPPALTAALVKSYWTIPDRQAETSVVLANPPLDAS
ncbi:MAG: GNAT family N-acetyltransferase [Solirubrobacterales bacterium]|nr:GNAT family N-acetyltransferase [Solirubrobacterales bacterium]MBV9535305.1 GNAT family N-acetyltransferase [Solirubrobacterales bacterium]